VLRALNRVYFSQSHDHLYFTIWYGIADWHTEHYVMLVVAILPQFSRSGMQESEVSRERSASRCFGHANYPTLEVPLLFPTELYLFSDGVFETRRQQETASLDRLSTFLSAE